MRWAVPTLALVAACGAEQGMHVGDTPTDASDVCEPASAEVVDRSDAPAAGFKRAPDEFLGDLVGRFPGTLALGDDAVPGLFHVNPEVGEVRAMTWRWRDAGSLCLAWYEVDFIANLAVGDGLLDEVFAATALVTATEVTFEVGLPVDQLHGSLRPDDRDPDAWYGADLAIRGVCADGWVGDLTWIYDDGAERQVGSFSFTRAQKD